MMKGRTKRGNGGGGMERTSSSGTELLMGVPVSRIRRVQAIWRSFLYLLVPAFLMECASSSAITWKSIFFRKLLVSGLSY